MSSARVEDKSSDIPERLYDASSGKTYMRMRFFGKVRFLSRKIEILEKKHFDNK